MDRVTRPTKFHQPDGSGVAILLFNGPHLFDASEIEASVGKSVDGAGRRCRVGDLRIRVQPENVVTAAQPGVVHPLQKLIVWSSAAIVDAGWAQAGADHLNAWIGRFHGGVGQLQQAHVIGGALW